MRARASTIGLNAGWTVTSSTRSPSIQTSRPSRIDSRYSSPVRIMPAVNRPPGVAVKRRFPAWLIGGGDARPRPTHRHGRGGFPRTAI